MARFTVLGGTGFVGAHLARFLRVCGDEVVVPPRDAALSGDLSHVVYAIGLTADFRTRPFATIEAHVCRLSRLLERAKFESLLYLSSTRVYARTSVASEDMALAVDPTVTDDLYNVSKLAGESLCLSRETSTVRVARLSNIVGTPVGGAAMHPESTVAAFVRSAARDGVIRLAAAPESRKDYLAAEDTVRAIRRIALGGQHRLYNVAHGTSVSNGEIAERLAELTGCRIEVASRAPLVTFPTIDTERLRAEFSPPDEAWNPASILTRLRTLVEPARPALALIGG